MLKKIHTIVLLVCVVCVYSGQSAVQSHWKLLEPGLEVANFKTPIKAQSGNSTLMVVRIDPAYFNLKLLCAAQLDSINRTTKQWSSRYDLVAAINAGMYARDYSTNVGYMKNFEYINNGTVRKDYKSILAFNSVATKVSKSVNGVAPVQIIDLECQNFTALRSRYNTFVQNIRMLNCKQQNVWKAQPQATSIAALGIDKTGKVLLLFVESSYRVYDFVENRRKLPLGIKTAMYLEGGSPASLYVHSGTFIFEGYGVAERSQKQTGTLLFPRALPNVIGVERRVKISR